MTKTSTVGSLHPDIVLKHQKYVNEYKKRTREYWILFVVMSCIALSLGITYIILILIGAHKTLLVLMIVILVTMMIHYISLITRLFIICDKVLTENTSMVLMTKKFVDTIKKNQEKLFEIARRKRK